MLSALSDLSKAPAYVTQATTNIVTILGILKTLNADAKIYIMGYYNTFNS